MHRLSVFVKNLEITEALNPDEAILISMNRSAQINDLIKYFSLRNGLDKEAADMEGKTVYSIFRMPRDKYNIGKRGFFLDG